ncbi:MAG: hypothetical protein J6C84_06740 [Lachnospiraceae bacterium]|nr:hypothetical protein [Lachnospiraceae bacterium]
MGFWQKLFSRKKKQKEVPQDDWESIVYDREGVDFADEEQRSRYVTGCLEQIAEASKEIDLLTGEYTLVTSYLKDMEEIEALPGQEKEEIERLANKLMSLEREMQRYRGRQNRMSDGEYYRIRKQEAEVAEGIRKIKEGEKYASLIKKDLRRLDGERHAYAYRRSELLALTGNLRGMAVIFLTAFVICMLMLLVLQFGFEMNTGVGYFLAVGALAVALTVLCVKYMDADREIIRVENAINKLIQLQNKVKIRYVNNSQLLDYLYMKYDTDSGDRLEKRWNEYQQEKEERKQYAEAEAKTEYYQKMLVEQLSHFHVSDPGRWTHQVNALIDRREMVEIRHSLILRRQALRKQMDYNNGVAEAARKEVMDVAEKHPDYAKEILDMVERYETP